MQAHMAATFGSVGALGGTSQLSNLIQHHSDAVRRLVETHPNSLHTELNRLTQQFHDDLNRSLGVTTPPLPFPQYDSHTYYNAAAPPPSLLPPPRAMTPSPRVGGYSGNNSYLGTPGTPSGSY